MAFARVKDQQTTPSWSAGEEGFLRASFNLLVNQL